MAADRERESPRVEGVFRVRYATLDQLVVAYSADLSKGGMFLASDQFLPVNSTIRLVLELPGQGGELAVSCRVVYLRDKITAENRVSGGSPFSENVRHTPSHAAPAASRSRSARSSPSMTVSDGRAGDR
jgi:Tfp pilus assembly protein PilZ